MKAQPLKDVFLKLTQGDLIQIYYLQGDDYFLQDYFVKKLEKCVFGDDVAHRELLIPDDIGQQEIIDRLNQADLFSSKKLFVIRNPQQIKNKPRDELLQFCSKPIPNHFLVIIMDDFYSQLKIAKVLQKELAPIDVRKPFEKELRLWTKRFFDDQGIDAPPSVVQAVLEIAGDSVYHIANQVEKICLGLGENDILTPEVVQRSEEHTSELQSPE